MTGGNAMRKLLALPPVLILCLLLSVAPDWGLAGEGGYPFVFDAEAAQAEPAGLKT